MGEQRNTICKPYSWYGACKRGKNCSDIHEEDLPTPVLKVATILELRKCNKGSIITVKEHGITNAQYFLSQNAWYRADAKANDYVVIQKCNGEPWRIDGKNYPCVRVVRVLENCVRQTVNVPKIDVIDGAFTVDPVGTYIRDDALSVETCKDHGVCKKIGIHVVLCENVSKAVSPYSVPFYGNDWKAGKQNGFVKDEWNLALSVFVHFAEEKLESKGPMITYVRIKETHEYGAERFFNSKHPKPEEADKLSDEMEILWKHFVGDRLMGNLFKSNVSRYIVDYPGSWRKAVLVEYMMKEYDRIITEFVCKLTKSISFITKDPVKELDIKPFDTATAFKDEWENASTSDKSKNDLPLLARAVQFVKVSAIENNFTSQRYQADVEDALSLRPTSVVHCTSPLRDLKHLLNQQILYRCVINLDTQLYTRDDLVELLVPRFQSPTLKMAIFHGFRQEKSSIMLQYLGGRSALRDIEFSVFNRPDDSRAHHEMAEIYYTDLHCYEEYCNRDLVEFVSTAKGNDPEKIPDNLKSLVSQKYDKKETSPYDAIKNEGGETLGTRLTLKRGAQLQVQISDYDAKEHGLSLGLRMLRIGRNCHLCFTHISYPEKAFMSDINGVRDLIGKETIIAIQKASTIEVLAASKYIRGKVEITWPGGHFFRGSFKLGDVSCVEEKDLLCIRQEIPDDGNPEYIWCCHGIVEKVEANTIKFLTCTLSQQDDPLKECQVDELSNEFQRYVQVEELQQGVRRKEFHRGVPPGGSPRGVRPSERQRGASREEPRRSAPREQPSPGVSLSQRDEPAKYKPFCVTIIYPEVRPRQRSKTVLRDGL